MQHRSGFAAYASSCSGEKRHHAPQLLLSQVVHKVGGNHLLLKGEGWPQIPAETCEAATDIRRFGYSPDALTEFVDEVVADVIVLQTATETGPRHCCSGCSGRSVVPH